MQELWQSLNNREIALLVWGNAFTVFGIIVARQAIPGLLKAFLPFKVSGVFATLLACVILTVCGLKSLGLWDITLLKDTIVWFFTVACVSVFKASKGSESRHMFREMFLDTIAITTILGFVVDSFVLPLAAELVLVPLLTLISLMAVLAQHNKEHKALRRPLHIIIGAVGLALVAHAVRELFRSGSEFATWDTAKEFVLEPALTVCAIPFFLAFSVASEYEGLFLRMDIWLRDRPGLIYYAKWRSFASAGFNLKRLNRLRGEFCLSLQSCQDKEEIARVIRSYATRPEPDELPGEVVRVKVLPYMLPGNGQVAQKVVIDWKNLSDRAVGAAYADIEPYDSDGDALESGAKSYCVFASDDDTGKVKPGETYRQPEDGGFVLLSNVFGKAARVDVRITKLLEK